jgi:hypothetical protein
MIVFAEFFEQVKNSKDVKILEEEAQVFFNSLIELGIIIHAIQLAHKKKLTLVERKLFADLMELSKNKQLPFLQKIAKPSLDIYKNSDEVLVAEFIDSIQDEVKLKDCRLSRREVREIVLRAMVRRLKIYRHLFEIKSHDVAQFKAEAEQRVDEIVKKHKTTKVIVGVTTLATLATGAAILKLFWKGDKK